MAGGGGEDDRKPKSGLWNWLLVFGNWDDNGAFGGVIESGRKDARRGATDTETGELVTAESVVLSQLLE